MFTVTFLSAYADLGTPQPTIAEFASTAQLEAFFSLVQAKVTVHDKRGNILVCCDPFGNEYKVTRQ